MNDKLRLASTLLALGHALQALALMRGFVAEDISYEEAKSKKLTSRQIIARYEWDHYPVRKADGGPDEPWNLVPRLIAAHRDKTARIDLPEIAKGKRIRAKWQHHQQRMAEK